jgi:hypothetical protein
MSHAIFTQVNQGDFQFLMVILTILKYPNESREPILDIYIARVFQWYKKCFNPMSFDPCNRSENLGVHFGMWGFNRSHFPTLPKT